MTTLTDIYRDRSYLNESTGKYHPHFWKPQPIARAPFTLWGDDSLPVDPNWGVEEAIAKCIALGIVLELDVGAFVAEAIRKDLPQTGEPVKELLLANVQDETHHLKGFEYMAKAYPIPVQVTKEAELLQSEWNLAWETGHPLEAPQVMETGLFAITLSFLRLAGGASLASSSARILEDESRHMATNRAVLRQIGLNPASILERHQEAKIKSLDWIFGKVAIPATAVGVKFDLDFVLTASTELIEKGRADDLNEVTIAYDHTLPFENSNQSKYSRSY